MRRETRPQWVARVARWRASGLSASDFAAREGVKANTLRWWASACRRPRNERPAFVEVALTAPSSTGGIEIVLSNGVVIRLSGHFGEAVLQRVLAVLRGR